MADATIAVTDPSGPVACRKILGPANLRASSRTSVNQAQRRCKAFRGAITGTACVPTGESLDELAADVAKDGVAIEGLKGAMNEYPTETDVKRASARHFLPTETQPYECITRQAWLAKLREPVHQSVAFFEAG